MQHNATLLGATSCVSLATLLQCVATCCDMLGVVGSNGQILCCRRLARFMQKCCAQACTLARFLTPNMFQHVATGWPNARNMLHPTMLGYVGFKCCNYLAGACKCWANNVGICCVEMLRSFGWGLSGCCK